MISLRRRALSGWAASGSQAPVAVAVPKRRLRVEAPDDKADDAPRPAVSRRRKRPSGVGPAPVHAASVGPPATPVRSAAALRATDLPGAAALRPAAPAARSTRPAPGIGWL